MPGVTSRLLAEAVGALIVVVVTAGLYRLMGFGRRRAGFDAEGPPGPGDVASNGLLTTHEVSSALGRPVVDETVRGLDTLSTTMFRPAGRRGLVLLVQTSWGRMGATVRWLHGRGEPLLAVGDRAWVRRRRAIAYVGSTTLMLTVKRQGRGIEPNLFALVGVAAGRVRARARLGR
jgi:hypothetical protein